MKNMHPSSVSLQIEQIFNFIKSIYNPFQFFLKQYDSVISHIYRLNKFILTIPVIAINTDRNSYVWANYKIFAIPVIRQPHFCTRLYRGGKPRIDVFVYRAYFPFYVLVNIRQLGLNSDRTLHILSPPLVASNIYSRNIMGPGRSSLFVLLPCISSGFGLFTSSEFLRL